MIPIAATMLACPNLVMPAQIMYHVAEVESDFNPFAIGVVGGRLLRQPASLDEAVATAQILESKGYNYSLGLAQVNRANLQKYGLDTYTKAFDICDNLAAGSRILAQCYAGAGGEWGKAFSCYYAGDTTTGFRDGYVQKIFAAFNRGSEATPRGSTPRSAIPLARRSTHLEVVEGRTPAVPYGGAAYRVAIRSMALDVAAQAVVAPLAKTLGVQPADAAAVAHETTAISATPTSGAAPAAGGPGPRARAVFQPQVTGPNDTTVATATGNSRAAASSGRADVIQQNTGDDAFVF